MNFLLALMVGVLTVACFVSEVESIKCFQCTTNDQFCEPINKDKVKSSECSPGQDMCTKTTYTQDNGKVMRECATKLATDKLDCSGKPVVCKCQGTECNGSGVTTPRFAVMGVTAAFMTAYRMY